MAESRHRFESRTKQAQLVSDDLPQVVKHEGNQSPSFLLRDAENPSSGPEVISLLRSAGYGCCFCSQRAAVSEKTTLRR